MNNTAPDDYNELILEDEPADNLSEQTEVVNLRATYPLAHRSVFEKAWLWILTFLSLILLLRYGEHIAVSQPAGVDLPRNPLMSLQAFDHVSYYLFWAGMFLLSCKLIYEEFYHMTFYYGIEAEHLVITSGVLLKVRSSLHTSLITDIFLTKNPIELILWVYSLQVANPSPDTTALPPISSLSRKNAVALQDYLVDLVSGAEAPEEMVTTVHPRGPMKAMGQVLKWRPRRTHSRKPH